MCVIWVDLRAGGFVFLPSGGAKVLAWTAGQTEELGAHDRRRRGKEAKVRSVCLKVVCMQAATLICTQHTRTHIEAANSLSSLAFTHHHAVRESARSGRRAEA